MDIDIRIIFAVLCLAASLGIGVWAGRSSKTANDWMVTGRRLGLPVFATAFIATMVSGFGAVGAPGLLYSFGWGPWVALTAIVVSTPITFILMAKPLWIISKRYNAPTIPHVLHVVYGSRRIQVLASLIIALLAMAYMVVQWAAAARLGQGLLDLSYEQSLIIFVVVVGIYSAVGGSIATSYTDFMQACIMLVGVTTVTIVGMTAVDGVVNMNNTINESSPELLQLSNEAFRPELLFSLLVIFGLVQGGDIRTLSRLLFVRSVSTFRWAPLVAGGLYILVSNLIWLVGLYTRALIADGEMTAPAAPDLVMFAFLNQMVPAVVAGLIYAAVIAAIMSTIDSVLVLTSSALVHDVAGSIFGVEMGERRKLLFLRICTVGVVGLTVSAALRPPELIGLLAADVIGVFCASFFAVLVLGLRWRRSTPNAAFLAMLVGFVLAMTFVIGEARFGWQVPVISGAGWAVFASIAVMVGVSLMGPRPAIARIERLRDPDGSPPVAAEPEIEGSSGSHRGL